MLFMIIVYIGIAYAVKEYVDWVYGKSWFWIILITLLVITLPRTVLNLLPKLMGDTKDVTDALMTIATILNWFFRVLYLVFMIYVTNFDYKESVILALFCYLLFLGLSNFFGHGIFHHIMRQETKELA